MKRIKRNAELLVRGRLNELGADTSADSLLVRTLTHFQMPNGLPLSRANRTRRVANYGLTRCGLVSAAALSSTPDPLISLRLLLHRSAATTRVNTKMYAGIASAR